uniref:Beta-1,4-N-acetyl-galactosaminyl transferase 2, tandem duplicate 2 n=1 Tax=Cyprinus carpio TaxID=7962 RepID=A0A8C1TWB6_CYPCA
LWGHIRALFIFFLNKRLQCVLLGYCLSPSLFSLSLSLSLFVCVCVLHRLGPILNTNHSIDGANLDRFIIASDNSPLQYPITGFTVSPMQKSLIPGMYVSNSCLQVSLSVKSGVLSVEDVLDGDQVEGQGQSELTISSSNLTQLMDLLSRVTYTSTIYHIRTSECVNTGETSSPLQFRCQLTGDHSNQDISEIYCKELNVIKSILMFYTEIKIIISNDSLNLLLEKTIERYIMPATQVNTFYVLDVHVPKGSSILTVVSWYFLAGLQGGSQVTTKYFLWVDNDFVFFKGTRIESFVEIMEAVPELDIVSCKYFFFLLLFFCLTRVKKGFHQPLPNFDDCILVDGVVYYFLGRTDAVRRVGFDPYLKRVGHSGKYLLNFVHCYCSIFFFFFLNSVSSS